MRRHLLTLASVTLVAAAIAAGITVFFIGDLLAQRRDPISGPVDAAERRVVVASLISLGLLAVTGLSTLVRRLLPLPPVHGPLGEVLAEAGDLPPEPRSWLMGWPLRITGAGLWFAIPVVGGAIFATQRADLPLVGKGVLILVLVGIGYALLVTGSLAYNQGRQNALGIEAARAVEDPRDPVLYLRPFRDDLAGARQLASGGPLVFWVFPSRSEEDLFTRVLSKAGPLVAVGEPGEAFRQIGAIRFHVRGEHWQQVVRALLTRARLVVLRCGYGEGFWWEVELAVRTLEPERLVLLIPFDEDGYERFRGRLQAHLPSPLPPIPDAVHGRLSGLAWGAVYFRPGWRPEWAIFATEHEPMAYHMYRRIVAELWPAADQLGISVARWYLPASLRHVAIRAAVVIGFLVVLLNIVQWGDTFVWA